MKLKSIKNKMACWQKVVIVDFSKGEIIFEGLANEITKELEQRNVIMIGISNDNKIMIDVMGA